MKCTFSLLFYAFLIATYVFQVKIIFHFDYIIIIFHFSYNEKILKILHVFTDIPCEVAKVLLLLFFIRNINHGGYHAQKLHKMIVTTINMCVA